MLRQFDFHAGSVSLNLVDTVSDRSGVCQELLLSPAHLTKWLHGAGIADGIDIDAAFLDKIRRIREAAFVVLSAIVDAKPLNPQAIDLLNEQAGGKDFRPRFSNGRLILESDTPCDALCATIAADVLFLLQVEKRARLRRCVGCAMLFLDNSRPQKRRWCSSSSGCGNRAKVRRHRSNKRKERKIDR